MADMMKRIEIEVVIQEEIAQKARLAVCKNAEDVEDARILLDMLGLVPDPVRFPAWVTPPRGAARPPAQGPAAPLPPARYGGVSA